MYKTEPAGWERTQASDAPALRCGDCGSSDVSTQTEVDRFVYGTGPDAIELSAEIPVHECRTCGFQFTTTEAEQARHSAVCQHLELLTPSKIRALRGLYGFSTEEFARVTRIGLASILRWERGSGMQNAAYDDYLYLLGWTDNMQRLQHRRQQRRGQPEPGKRPVFRTSSPSDVDRQTARDQFKLRPQAA
jgi:DNA-binding transcriptional regulator YiaG